jgi:hypothetical protein
MDRSGPRISRLATAVNTRTHMHQSRAVVVYSRNATHPSRRDLRATSASRSAFTCPCCKTSSRIGVAGSARKHEEPGMAA